MRILYSLLTFAIATSVLAQKADKEKKLVESRDQAQGWYLPVKGNVTFSGDKAGDFTITVFQDNKELGQVKASKKGAFNLELDIDNFYAVRIEKEGYQAKLVYFDTHMPEQQVAYPPYICNLNLEPADKYRHSDPFYLDFPSAIVRWNEELKGFYHNEGYLSDIQVKMAMLQAQVEP
jgi:hypothetical protein